MVKNTDIARRAGKRMFLLCRLESAMGAVCWKAGKIGSNNGSYTNLRGCISKSLTPAHEMLVSSAFPVRRLNEPIDSNFRE